MTTTTLTKHEHGALKQGSTWPIAWNHGKWIEREDTMVFLVDEKPRAFMPKEEFAPFMAATSPKDESRHR